MFQCNTREQMPFLYIYTVLINLSISERKKNGVKVKTVLNNFSLLWMYKKDNCYPEHLIQIK